MQISVLILLFSFSLVVFARKITLSVRDSYTLALSCFVFRIFAYLGLIALVGNSQDYLLERLTKSESPVIVSLVFLSFYLILLFFSSKVLLKALGRNAELIARFSLDALPGEQIAVDISKKDGIFTIREAEQKRHEVLSSALTFGSLDPKIKLLSFEPLLIMFCGILNAALIVAVSESGDDYQKSIFEAVSKSCCNGTIMLLSSVLTTLPLFSTIFNFGGSDVGKDIRLSEYLKSSLKLFYAISIGFLVLEIPFYLITVGVVKYLSDTWLVWVLIFASAGYYLQLSKKAFKKEWYAKKSPVGDLMFLASVPAQTRSSDLIINFRGRIIGDQEESFLKKIVLGLRDEGSLVLPIHGFHLKAETDSAAESSSLSITWGVETHEFALLEQDLKNVKPVVNQILGALALSLKSNLLISDIAFVLNDIFIEDNRTPLASGMTFEVMSFIKTGIMKVHDLGLVVHDLVAFFESSMKWYEDEDFNAILKDLIKSDPNLIKGADGVCRVIYLDGNSRNDLEKAVEIISTKVKRREVVPIVIIMDELSDWLEEYTLEPGMLVLPMNVVPKSLEYFPIARLS